MSKWLLAVSAVLVIGTAVGFAAAAKDKEDKNDMEQDDAQVVTLDKLPAAARDALTKLAGDAKLGEVTMEDEDGVKVYEASWQASGVEHEAEVTEHGDVVQTEQVVNLDAMPKAVQRAATNAFPKGTKLKLEKKTIVLYEVEAEIDGQEKEVLVAPTGQRVEIDHEDGETEDNDAR
jgi:uncharacterized membrane protein YkoI